MCAGLFTNLISMESRKHDYGGGVRFVAQRQGRGGAEGSGVVPGEPDWHCCQSSANRDLPYLHSRTLGPAV